MGTFYVGALDSTGDRLSWTFQGSIDPVQYPTYPGPKTSAWTGQIVITSQYGSAPNSTVVWLDPTLGLFAESVVTASMVDNSQPVALSRETTAVGNYWWTLWSSYEAPLRLFQRDDARGLVRAPRLGGHTEPHNTPGSLQENPAPRLRQTGNVYN
jgi:hypothetical protein